MPILKRPLLAAAGFCVLGVLTSLPAQAALTGSCGPTSTSVAGTITDFTAYLIANSNQCQISDKLFSNFNYAAWANYPGDAQISLSESGSEGITHSITVSSATGFNNTAGYSLNYTITKTGTQTLDWWRPSSASSLNNPEFDITWTATNPANTSSRDENSGLSPKNFFTPGTTTTNVTTAIAPINDGPQSISLTLFQTPGPLPIMGAGVAFGFSRRLRNRIKLSN